jgi:hypothetical protein
LKRAAATLLEWIGPFLERTRRLVALWRLRLLVLRAVGSGKRKFWDPIDTWVIYQHHLTGFWEVKDKEEALKRLF